MGYNILLVDDSVTVRQVLKKALHIAQVPLTELLEAGNGEEALAVLRDHWIDLVFMDLNMPGMGGAELYDNMRQDEEMKDVPVVVISTEGSKTRIEELKRKGIFAYIRKPFQPEQVRDVVGEVLGGMNDEE